MNQIVVTQNSLRNLRRLAAQRDLYSEAKRIQVWLIAVSTMAVIIWSGLSLANPVLKPYASLWACCATLLDVLVLSPMVKDKKSKAARIQEEFDCDVLELQWSDCKAGDRAEPELLSKHHDKGESDPDFEKLKDWYPANVQKIPLHLARLLCQRSCGWWERNLRQRYARTAMIVVVLAIIVIVVLGMLSGATVVNAVSVVLMIQPSLILLVRIHRENNDAAENAERVRKLAEGLWRRAVSGQLTPDEATVESRHLQNEIFDHRVRSPLVFDWIYNWLRDRHEEQMQAGTAVLIEEYFRKRPETSTN
jgi:hypothetical protein